MMTDQATLPETQDQEAPEAAAESMADTVALLDRIRDQNALVMRAKEAWDDLKEDAAAAKRTYDNRVGKLIAMIAERPPETPLFDGEADAWRSVTMSDLGLSESICEALADHPPGIVTLADLVAWQEAKGDFWAKDIKGVGSATATTIAEAAENYWAEHPRPEAAPAEDAAQ